MMTTDGTSVTSVAKTRVCVTFIRAVFRLPRARWMEATTEHPAPSISATPMSNISTGMQMLMAATPSLPTPWPTKIPSMAVTADILSIPSSVGMKYLLNNLNTFTLPKSIASLSIFHIFNIRLNEKMPDKLIGFTQSSYPAFYNSALR